MSNRELAALGVSLPVTVTDEATVGSSTETTSVDDNPKSATMSATISAQVSPYHDVVDLLSPEGKKLRKKATEGLPNDQKHDGDAKDIIKFVECVESKGEDFGWNSIASNIGPENINIFNTPGKLTVETCKLHCDPK